MSETERSAGDTPESIVARRGRWGTRVVASLLILGLAIAFGQAYTPDAAQAQEPVLGDLDESGDVSPGDTLSYEIRATNTGAVTLTNVVVSDQLSGQSLRCPTLGPGAVCLMVATYVVSQADVQVGQVSTSASATSDQTGLVPLPAPATVFLPRPALSIEALEPDFADKDGDGVVSAGDTLAYEITATNTGTANLSNVVVQSSLATASGGSTPCALIGPGQSCSLTGTYVITAADIKAPELEDVATASTTQTGSQEARLTIALPETPAIEITKTGTLDLGADGQATPGDTISFAYTVANKGNVALTGVVVNDPAAAVAGCAIGTLEVGAVDSTTCTGTYVLTQEDIDAGGLVAEAEAKGGASGQIVTDVSAGEGTALSIPQAPGLSVDRALTANADEDGSGGVSAGDSLTFEVTATNTGNVMLTNVLVGDRLTGDEKSCASVAPIDSCALTFAYDVTRDNVSGGIPNLAYASSDQTGEVAPAQPIAEVASARFVPPSNFLVQLPGLSGVVTDVGVVGTNVSLALLAVLTLLVATTVFNSTLEENATEIESFVKRISGAPKAAPAFAALGWISEEEAGGKSPWLHFLKPFLIVLATAVIYALLEPGFGLNEQTMVVVAALIAGITVSTFLYEGGQVLWSTKRYDTPASMRVYPLAILIAIGCVGLTRITNLHPGIIFGFVTAAAIFPRGEMPREANGKIVAVPLMLLMLAAFVAFLLIDPLHDFTTSHPSVYASLPETIAVAVFVGGAGSALLILIPVTFNDGEKIWKWSKLIWFGMALPATFAFIHVIVNDEDYGEIAESTNTMTLLVLCAIVLIVAAVTWLFFRMRNAEPAI